ncbi:MAG: PepSY-like domain-containing protein [Paramuribaculum sp.]|nr:PepSY-like domain-containing protein [Paramuribaculum sp.]
MIRKILLSFAIILGITSIAQARDNFSRDASVLPKPAQTVIGNNFKSKVNLVKTEKTLGKVTEYEVIMTDGTEISFDRDGNWQSIEVGTSSSIPSFFILPAISDYVKKNESGQKIVGIEKERNGFEVELSNGIDMKFDKQGNFLRYD